MWRTVWKVRKLGKGSIRLKQSGSLWNNLLVVKLVVKHGMEQCKADPCVFRKIVKGVVVLILTVHVDDMAVAGPRVEVENVRDSGRSIDLSLIHI